MRRKASCLTLQLRVNAATGGMTRGAEVRTPEDQWEELGLDSQAEGASGWRLRWTDHGRMYFGRKVVRVRSKEYRRDDDRQRIVRSRCYDCGGNLLGGSTAAGLGRTARYASMGT